MRIAWLCAAPALIASLVAASPVACSHGGSGLVDGGTGADGDYVDLGTPMAVPPSLPGYLAVGPAGLQLAPGKTAQLTAQLYDSAGNAQPEPQMTWTSSAMDVLSVSAA